MALSREVAAPLLSLLTCQCVTLQMRRAGLDKALADMVEITYVDAPNDASGPPPEDVKPFFQVQPLGPELLHLNHAPQ